MLDVPYFRNHQYEVGYQLVWASFEGQINTWIK